MLPGSSGTVKLGQSQPLSYVFVEVDSGLPDTTST
jgi:hypothetical protein